MLYRDRKYPLRYTMPHMRENYGASGDVIEKKIASKENTERERLSIDEKGEEFLDLDIATAQKISYLLESQKDVLSDDVEELLMAGDKIQGANCHKTALFMTGKISRERLFELNNDDPVTAGHAYVEGHSNLYPDIDRFNAALSQKTFPFRVSFFKSKEGKDFAYHSITVLGMSNKKTLVGFEKEGPYADNPFRYINATEVITAHILHKYIPGLEV